MASIGEKIKEVFTGHSHSEHNDASDVKTPDVDAPGAYPSDKPTHKDSELLSKPNKASSGHKHSDSGVEIGRGHHDPEIDAKQATSAAGNYPVSKILDALTDVHTYGTHNLPHLREGADLERK